MRFRAMHLPPSRHLRFLRLGWLKLIAATATAGLGASLLFHSVATQTHPLSPLFVPRSPTPPTVQAPKSVTEPATPGVAHPATTPDAPPKRKLRPARQQPGKVRPVSLHRTSLGQATAPAETESGATAGPPPVEEPAPPIEVPPAESPAPPIELPPADSGGTVPAASDASAAAAA
jgi:hypothetical protein